MQSQSPGKSMLSNDASAQPSGHDLLLLNTISLGLLECTLHEDIKFQKLVIAVLYTHKYKCKFYPLCGLMNVHELNTPV